MTRGLAWSDLDLDGGTVRVRQALQRVEGRFALVEPKSATSRRIVALPAIVRVGLLAHRQRAAQAGPGRAVPDRFAELVFTTTVGTPIDGISVTRRFQRILKDAWQDHRVRPVARSSFGDPVALICTNGSARSSSTTANGSAPSGRTSRFRSRRRSIGP